MATIPPAVLAPDSDERGLLSSAPEQMVEAINASWTSYLNTIEGLDFATIDSPPLRRIQELGTWPGDEGLSALIAEAAGDQRRTATSTPAAEPDKSATLDALQRSFNDFTIWAESDERAQTAAGSVSTPLGPLPLLTALHGVSYSQTLTLLPLLGSDDARVRALLPYALSALVDTTGAFAARASTTASLVALTSSGNVGTGADSGAWRTLSLDAQLVSTPSRLGPRVMADAATLIAVTAGQADVPRAYRSGQLRFAELSGLMRWVPVLEHVPGMPAAAALGRAANYIAGMSGLLSRFGL